MIMMPNDHHEINASKLLNHGSRLGTDGGTEEKNVQDDDSIAYRSASGMHGINANESDLSNCSQSTEGKASGVDNDSNNFENGIMNNLRSRARRKSKYLCPPFIDIIKGDPKKESESPSDKSIQPGDSPSLVKSGRKRKQSKKSVAASVNLEAITASSADLLSQIHKVAHDYLIPYYDKAFDPTKLFFSSFRASVFSGLDQTRTDEGDDRKKTKRKKKVEPSTNCDANVNVVSSSPLKVDPQTACNPLSGSIEPKRKRKRKVEQLANPEAKETDQIPETEPGKPKKIRKRKANSVISMFGFPCANVNSVKPKSFEVCMQNAGPMPYASAASTGLNTNIVSPPGFCAEGSTTSTPAPPTGFQHNLNADIVSSPGLCAKDSIPSTLAPPSGFQSNLNANIVSSSGLCANDITSSTLVPPFGFQSNLNGNIVNPPGLWAKDSTPSTLAPPCGFQPNLNANIVSSPGLCAKDSTLSTPTAPSGYHSILHANIVSFSTKVSTPSSPSPASGFQSNSHGNIISFCTKVPTPSTSAPPSGFQSNLNANSVSFCTKDSTPSTTAAPASGLQCDLNANIVSSPGFSAKKGSTQSTPVPPSGFQFILNANIVSSPGSCAKGSTLSTPAAPPSGVQSMGRVNTANDDPLQGIVQGEPKSEPVKKKKIRKKRVKHLTTMFSNPCAFGNNVKPVSLEARLQEGAPRPYGFAASAGLNVNVDSSSVSCGKSWMPSTPAPPSGSQSMGRVNTPIGSDAANTSKSNVKPSLDQMKQSLEFMTSMLEKSGDTISPAMRANLEKEIKNLLQKVNPMIRSSS